MPFFNRPKPVANAPGYVCFNNSPKRKRRDYLTPRKAMIT